MKIGHQHIESAGLMARLQCFGLLPERCRHIKADGLPTERPVQLHQALQRMVQIATSWRALIAYGAMPNL